MMTFIKIRLPFPRFQTQKKEPKFLFLLKVPRARLELAHLAAMDFESIVSTI